ncbi:MAG: tRNA uridine-5-carboxymethylaminomethyl(34) synthesis enzyme MnmG [Lachnospiraceae bacterium]|nr:tRNA uridine-5-carboxymethylaminomethyl(34) synthesis enzyme MnmG [Lachnospiraceae bacterium]
MIIENYEAAVIGAGHAGCEAALALARNGIKTIVFTVSINSIALMPCNPNIGGSSKGHLVREIDALGGEMAHVIDRTFIQSKMLNKSKGPAVHSLRAQADKAEYSKEMRRVLERQENLDIKQAEVTEIFTDDENNVTGIKIRTGIEYKVKAVVLCTGVYLKARCLCGEAITYTGPNGLQAANSLSESLMNLGIKIHRFKTGTPARISEDSIDFSKMVPQFGDVPVVPFSFSTDPDNVQKEQVKCYLTHTTDKTHEVIRRNLDRSPMYSGVIEGVGPRYCPSIEDKVVKFSDKESHQVFLEPEGLSTDEWYIDGMSSSLPEDVQTEMYRTVPGLENCRIVRNAYAIEYDCIPGKQLKHSLEFKDVHGLFSGGQINGSSGYEEAAAQGLIAGINAAMMILSKEAITIDRSEGYIGVLIDDLVTKESSEPYRMMTSRAEYRLLLRQDNADLRLRRKGFEAGLISKEQMDALFEKEESIKNEIERVSGINVKVTDELKEIMKRAGSTAISTGVTMEELIRRPELSYDMLSPVDPNRPDLSKEIRDQVNINIKYRGYIEREERQISQYKKALEQTIPVDINYDNVSNIRIEARQKLADIRPETIVQASMIQGISPADIQVLMVYIKSLGSRS